MSPRPYQAGPRRKAATAATRSRIVEAARELLADPKSAAFSIDAVAERAGVARMTVYYQFKSKAKLLEALFDDFAARANMRELRKAFAEPDSGRALDKLVDVFCRLWKTQRPFVRRLNAFAALDPEVDRALRERGGWRREALGEIVGRFRHRDAGDALVDVLHVLSSFETYDALAEAQRSPKEIPKLLRRACAALVASWEADVKRRGAKHMYMAKGGRAATVTLRKLRRDEAERQDRSEWRTLSSREKFSMLWDLAVVWMDVHGIPAEQRRLQRTVVALQRRGR